MIEAGATVQVALPIPVRTTFTYQTEEPLDVGVRVIVPLGARTMTGVVVGPGSPPPGLREIKKISRSIDEEPLFERGYLDFAEWMAQMYVSSLGECLAAMLPSARRARELPEARGDEPPSRPDYELSEEQHRAVRALTGESHGESWFYLYGITGSGKTEVFLRAAEAHLAAERSVIYLVPEIALTHQLFAHIQSRFGYIVSMLHSGLTPAQRLSEWRRIRTGEARLVVGARSAVFAPVARLGLVVVDEEHETSYKSGNAPRYHARQVALWRSSREGAVCVMGSATPSVEAWNLMAEGRLARLDLTRRLSGGALPEVSVVNVRGSDSLISGTLRDAIRETHGGGGQSILFLNRRGFGHVFHCRSCGFEMTCPHCSVALTYHRSDAKMVCHHCGYRAEAPRVCPVCASLDVAYASFGTERIEEEVAARFPGLTCARLDTDSTRKRGESGRILAAFERGEIDILLGTQMVAKGLNFPRVQTVGIVLADTGLSLPDFRAAERTFSLIVQVAGRAGRFRTDGRVIVQTMRPDHPAIRRAVEHRVEEFYADELETRRQLGFPPFGRLLRIVLRGGRAKDVAASIAELAEAIRRELPAGIEVMGPVPCALERIKRNWRHHLLLRGESMGVMHRVVRKELDAFRPPRGVHVEVDIDPVNLL